MCEVQIMRALNGTLDKEDLQNFYILMKKGGVSNRDAYGIFTNDYMFRKKGSFAEEKEENITPLTSNILKGNPSFIVGHNRLTTQGSSDKNHNNHPFPTKDWIIVHNGVIYNDRELCNKHNLEYKEETDSAIAVNLLQMYSDEGKSSTECIKRVGEELMGSFSICAYNRKEDRLFYFKNSSTSFSFILFELKNGKRVLCGSTSDDNFTTLYVKNYMIFYTANYDTFYETEADSGIVYEITNNEIIELDTFTPNTNTYSGRHYGSSYVSGYDSEYSTYGKTNFKGKKWKTTGGIYEEDWKDVEDLQTGKDLGFLDSEKVFFPEVSKADMIKSLEEDVYMLEQDLNEILGLEIKAKVDMKAELVKFAISDSPVGMNEICRSLKDKNSMYFSVVNENTIAVTFKEMSDIYA
jgi:hypothetical protein